MTNYVVGGQRHYGLNIGDLVEMRARAFGPAVRGTVVGFSATDNNRAYLINDNHKKPFDVVAEWCVVITPAAKQ